MIILKKEDLDSQAGMERAFRSYFEYVKQDCDGTYNAMMAPEFVSCDYEKNTLVLSMNTVDWMTNPGGILHGGVTASILDMAMGLLCRYVSGGYMTPTIDMTVSYLRSGSLHDTMYIEAQVTKRGFTICNATAKAWMSGEENRIVATASGSYFVTGKKG